MKTTKKVLALLTTLAMVFTMLVATGLTAFAADDTGITVENATYGKTYTAYKIFDATYSGNNVSYTVTAANKNNVSTDLFNISEAATDGKYSVWLKDGVTDDQVISWLKDNYNKFDAEGTPGVFNEDNYTVHFDVGPGYYFVTTTLGSAVTIDTAKPAVTIKDKNASEPTAPEKKIVSIDGAEANATTADVHVGSVIGFKITGNATNWTTVVDGDTITAEKNTEYTFEDTFENLEIGGDITVTVNGETVEGTTTVSGNKITVNIPLVDTDGNALYKAKNAGNAYIPIEITYSAKVTAAAANGPATNKAGDSENDMYTYMFDIAKVDGNNNNAPLKGAQFELWANGAALTFIDNRDGTYTYSADGTVTTLDMTENTTITVKGLDNAWTYTLKETKVPDGYNQAEDKTIAGSSLIKADGENESSEYTEQVINKAGTALPSTGGIGTTIFYVLGSLLVIGCGIVLVSRKRMQNNK